MKRFFAYLLSFLVMYQPVMLRAQIVVDNSAGSRPLLDTAPNGVPIVNITAPSGAGVSVNQFTEFNVGTEGVVINNAATTGNSQLAGAVYQNPLFQGGAAATTILNWTTGTNSSQLNGFTEIFGERANYIMANPNGITCNGCGFINTPRVTLTTGDPLLSGGAVTGFDVMSGDIAITGDGLNASEVDYFEIISRTAAITGQVNAQDLKVVAGQNHYDYDTKEITAQSDGSAKPAVAIDAYALGSIYAGRIAMVSTEDGVGVRTDNEMVANAGDIEINANGDIVYKQLASAQNIKVKSTQSITQTHKSVAGQGIEIESENIEIQNAVLATADEAHMTASTDISLIAYDTFTNAGELYADNAMTVQAKTMYNRGGIFGLNTLSISGNRLYNLDGAMLFGQNDLSITPTTLFENDHASVYSNGTLSIVSTDGTLHNSVGLIRSKDNMTLDVKTLQNMGETTGGYTVTDHYISGYCGHFCLMREERATSDLSTSPAVIQSDLNLLVTADLVQNHGGTMIANGDLTIETSRLENVTLSLLTRDLRRLYGKTWVTQWYDSWKLKRQRHYASYNTYYTVLFYSDLKAQILAGGNLVLTDVGNFIDDEALTASNTFYTDQIALNFDNTLYGVGQGTDPILTIDGRIYHVVDGKSYLVETRDLFEDGGEHMRSDYILARMGMDTSTQDRLFLGDEYYESQMIAQQVRQDRGELFVAGTTAGEQRDLLWENTIAIADDLELALGVELTIEQVARLTDPIVWYVEEEVDLGNGRTEVALVPRVYYPAEGTDPTQVVGGLVRAHNIQIASHRDVETTGRFKADEILSVDAQNITGQGANFEGNIVSLTVEEDLKLTALVGSVETTRTIQPKDAFGKPTGESFEVTTGEIAKLHNKGGIKAGTLSMTAGQDVIVSGTDAEITGDTTIAAAGDVTFGSDQVHNQVQIGQRGSDNYTYEESLEYVGTDMSVGGKLTVTGQNINVIGSQVDIAETATLDATENINVVATKDVDHKEHAYAQEDTFSSMAHKEVHIKNTHNLAGIRGKNVNMTSGNDTNIIGADVSAAQDLAANAGGNLNVAGVKDSEYHMVHHTESSFDVAGAIATMAGAALTGPIGMIGGAELAMDAEKGSADTRTTYDETVQNASLSAGNHLSLDATQDATFISTDLQSNAFTTVNAGGDILVGTMSEEHMDEHQHTEWGGDILGSFVGGFMAGVSSNIKATMAGYDSDMSEDLSLIIPLHKVGDKINEAIGDVTQTIDDAAQQATRSEVTDYARTDTILQQESNVLTNDLTTVSGNNTSILGSNVIVNNNANMQTGGDLIVAGVQETSSSVTRHEELSFDNISFSNTNSSASIHVEQKEEKSEQLSSSSTNKESNIRVGGNLTANSDKGITVIGSTVAADGEVNLTAVDDVQILAGENTYSTSDSYSKISNTITGTVGNQWVATAENAYNTANDLSESDWEETNSSAINNTAKILQTVVDAARVAKMVADAAKSASTAGTFGFYASASMTQAEEKSTSFSEDKQAVDSMIFGNNINIGTTSDIGIKGSTLVANNEVNLSGNNIVIESDQDTHESGSRSSSKSLTTTVSSSGFDLPTWSESTSESSTQMTTQRHSSIRGGTINTNSINDTTIAGADLTGGDINITTGGNLNIESRQDIVTSHSESQSISVGNNMGFAVSESNENTAWTNSVTSIDGQNVTINTKDMALTGAVVDGDNVVVNADTITAKDLEDHSYSDNASVSVGMTISTASQGNDVSQINVGFADGYHDKEGTTRATIGENATINATVDGDLNRDTDNIQIVTKDESDQIGIDLSVDTQMLTDTGDYVDAFANLGTNASNAGKQIEQAAVDLSDTVSAAYNGEISVTETGDHYNRQLNFSDATQSLSDVDIKALKDGNTSSQAYQNALNNLNQNYMEIYGVSKEEAEKIMLADIAEAGFRSKSGEGIFLNDAVAQTNRKHANETAAHEIMGHEVDAQKGISRGKESDEAFAESLQSQFGESLELAESLRGGLNLSDSDKAYLLDTSGDTSLVSKNTTLAITIPESQKQKSILDLASLGSSGYEIYYSNKKLNYAEALIDQTPDSNGMYEVNGERLTRDQVLDKINHYQTLEENSANAALAADATDLTLDGYSAAATGGAAAILGAITEGGKQVLKKTGKFLFKKTAKEGSEKILKEATRKGGKKVLKETTEKLSKVKKSKKTEKIGDKFTKTTEVKPGKGPGQSRAEYIRYKNKDGKTIRTYKDTYDRANKFQHRKPLRGGPEGRPQ